MTPPAAGAAAGSWLGPLAPRGGQQPGWEGQLWQWPPRPPALRHLRVPTPELGRALLVLLPAALPAALPAHPQWPQLHLGGAEARGWAGFCKVHTKVFAFLLLWPLV